MAQTKASLNSIYTEIRTLRHEVELIRTALIPEEKDNEKEINVIKIDKLTDPSAANFKYRLLQIILSEMVL